jgi:hypothetical protein
VTPEGGGEDINWWRAIASGLGILVVGLTLAVGGANYVLTDLTSLSRDNRQYVATFIFFAVVIGLAFALRRLQRRGLI